MNLEKLEKSLSRANELIEELDFEKAEKRLKEILQSLDKSPFYKRLFNKMTMLFSKKEQEFMARLMFQFGDLYYKLENYDSSKKYFMESLKYDAEQQETINYLSRIYSIISDEINEEILNILLRSIELGNDDEKVFDKVYNYYYNNNIMDSKSYKIYIKRYTQEKNEELLEKLYKYITKKKIYSEESLNLYHDFYNNSLKNLENDLKEKGVEEDEIIVKKAEFEKKNIKYLQNYSTNLRILEKIDDEALSIYKKLYELEPENKDNINILGQCYAKRKDLTEKSFEIYKKIYEESKKVDENILRILGKYYRINKIFSEDAINVFKLLFEECGADDIDNLKVYGKYLRNNSLNDDNAVKVYRLIFDYFSDDEENTKFLGTIYLEKKYVNEDVEKVYKKLIDFKVNLPDAYNFLGQINFMKKEYEISKEYLNKALKIHKREYKHTRLSDVYFYMGRCLIESKEYKESNDNIEKAIKLYSEYSEYYFYLAISYFKIFLKNHGKEDLFNTKSNTIDEIIENYDIYLDDINYLSLNYNISKAIEYFTISINMNTENKVAYFYRGLAYYYLKLFNVSYNDFRMYSDLDDDKNLINLYFLAKSSLRVEKYNEAIEITNSMIKINSKIHIFYYIRGIAYFLNDWYEEALKYFTDTIRVKNDYAPAYYYRAKVYENKKWYELAIDEIKIAISHNEKIEYFQELYKLLKLHKNSTESFAVLNTIISKSREKNYDINEFFEKEHSYFNIHFDEFKDDENFQVCMLKISHILNKAVDYEKCSNMFQSKFVKNEIKDFIGEK